MRWKTISSEELKTNGLQGVERQGGDSKIPPANSETEHMVRVVRRETREPNPMAPRLPIRPPRTAVIREEALIILILGIIPSFLWALFNASPGYIETGWLALSSGGNSRTIVWYNMEADTANMVV